MPLPVSHCLVGAIIVALLRPPSTSLKRNWLFLLFGALLAFSPDLDFFFVFILNWGIDWHRGFTHSIFFALFMTCLVWAAPRLSSAAAAHNGFLNVKAVLACGAALMSHGVLDALTTKDAIGVKLLFPFSGSRLKLGVFFISEFNDGFPLADVIKSGLIELIIFLPIFLVVVLLRGYLFTSPQNQSHH